MHETAAVTRAVCNEVRKTQKANEFSRDYSENGLLSLRCVPFFIPISLSFTITVSWPSQYKMIRREGLFRQGMYTWEWMRWEWETVEKARDSQVIRNGHKCCNWIKMRTTLGNESPRLDAIHFQFPSSLSLYLCFTPANYVLPPSPSSIPDWAALFNPSISFFLFYS